MRMLNVLTSLENTWYTYENAKCSYQFGQNRHRALSIYMGMLNLTIQSYGAITINLHMKILNVHTSLENAVTRNCSY